MNSVQIRHYDSVSAIRPAEWSRLSVLSGFSSYSWLQAVERYAAGTCAPRYVVACIQERPVGAVVLELVNDVDRESGIVRRLLGGRRVLRHTFGKCLVPNLVAGTPFGYGGQFLFDTSIGNELLRRIAQSLLSAVEELSESLRAPLWFSDVLASDVQLIQTLRDAGYLSSRYLPLAELAIEWHTFDDYVATLKTQSKNVAKDIRREQNRCRSAGVILEEPTDLGDLDKRFVELADQTYGKHGDLAFPFKPGFFSSLKRNLGDDFLVCNALEGGNVLGFVTMISDGHTAWAGNYGLDYTNNASAFVYFNLVLQWPVRKAIELGLKRLVLGRGHYELKIRRGCTLSDTYLFHKPSNALSRPVYARLFHSLDRHYNKQAGSNS
jgi:predicted N-acyltransferase